MKKTKGISADIIKGVIYVTKTFANRASVLGSDEEELFLQYQAKHPTFAIKKKITQITKTKVTHNGLTLEFMERYTANHAKTHAIISQFQTVIYDYTGHPAFYSKVKSWFLKQFPEHTAKHLSAEKAKRRRENANPKNQTHTTKTHIKTEVIQFVSSETVITSQTIPA